jgi:regulator of sigma E protease
MNEILWNIGSFIVALGILITIHEYGHYWVARKMGVKVLRFSVGFGKAIWSRTAADGTEYMIAGIPLGGYVKMLDEREGNVKPEERHLAFNNQPVTSRIAIVAAGPIANFLFAILVYIWMFVLGVPAVKPYLGNLPEQSIAQQAGLKAGDLITAVDGKDVGSWEAVNHAIASRMGEQSQLLIQVQHADESLKRDYRLDLTDWEVDPKRPDLLGSLGLTTWRPSRTTVLANIDQGGPADQAGLMAGDKVLAVNDQPVSEWDQMSAIIRANPDQQLGLQIERDGQSQVIIVDIGSIEVDGRQVGRLGVGSSNELSEADMAQIERMRTVQQYSFFEAIPAGLEKTWEIIGLSFRLIGKLFTGEVSPQNLSGPISIAQGAGTYASFGFVFFLSFLGLISINLGIINILPIPVLDGGHLLYYFIELIRGKPLSENVQEIGLRVGLMMVLSLMVFSIINDISRLS